MLGLLLIFVVLAIPTVSSQRVSSSGLSMPTFIVTSPERAQYDSALTFSISAANVAQRETIDLQLLTGTNNEITLQQTTLAFTRDGVQTWSVVVDSDRMLQHQQSRLELRAQHRSAVDRIIIDMDSLSGYIMIQTDKVIYTPRQTVMYRIIALDHDQRFAQWPVTVDIKNQDQIILERQHHTSQEAFRGRNFTLPRDALPGTWIISAYYQGKVMTSKFVTFEVQEYVLPTFTAKVKVEQKVIGQSTNWIQIATSAEYAYGQPVHGWVEMRLGIVRMNQAGGSQLTYTPFRQTYRGTLNVNGTWVKDVPISDLRYHDKWFPDGSRLYVAVNVTEAGTGENSTAVDIGTYFANPYYKISFTGSKKYFKPGFPYTMVVDVAAANGAPAAEVPVYVIMSLRDSEGHYLANGYSRLYVLDNAGRSRETFQVPENAETIKMQVMTLDPRVLDWSQAEMDVSKFLSRSNQYLHLEKDGNNIDIRFTPSATSWLGTLEYITVLIYSRGTLIHTDTVPRTATGRQTVRLSPEMLRLAAPSARVLAYFYTSVGTGASTEIVSDSLFIDTDDLCREELSLARLDDMGTGQQLPPKAPKERTDIVVIGGPNMTVGLLAVNKAVYFLKDERSLTRDKMFHFLGEHDLGRGIGDGKDTEKIFEFAGVKFIKLTEAYNPSLPEIAEVFDVSRLNAFGTLPKRSNHLNSGFQEVTDDGEAIPQDQVRRWFPESWFFTEFTLPSSGSMAQSFRLPDSITTWAFTAVGVGQDGGVCMSRPLDMVTFKPFFADVRLPYKAVRLEEVMVHIGIYNYRNFDINVTVTVTGDESLCFSEGVGGNKQFRYQASLERRKTNSETLRVIPLVAGTVKLMVDVRSRNGQERDIVEKTLHVVAEGRRVTKSITFPLDPSGKHSSHHTPSSNGRIQHTNTATITNNINTKSSKQLTEIDLYMPEEIIQGTERCQISACGDLMGDIISHAVMEGNNLFESSVQDAEEVIGNLAPAVHALLYLNASQFMTPHVLQKGKEHVIHGVARLLSYRKQSGSFALTTDSATATWLTALVLKTLCHAEKIAYVDHAVLIDVGFNWLLDQVDEEEGKLRELDRRLARPSREYDVMLNAEVIISVMECERTEQDDHNMLLANLLFPLEESLDEITSPLVMAKTAYALTLNDPMEDLTVRAVQRLSEMKRTTHDGLHYWAVNNEDTPPRRPFWYHSGTQASSIEATAYALLVYSRQAEMHRSMQVVGLLPDWHVNLDSIAGWLIQKRNSRGAFIGAMDTAAATQALSQYSQAKLGLEEVNLHCNVTTSPMENYTHIFDFNEENAIHPKALTDVPVGRQLHVETRGTGLGQMQVRVEYNVPVEANALCRYNLTVTRRSMSYHRLRDSENDVCAYCNMGCEGEQQSDDTRSSAGVQRRPGGRRRQRRQITATRSSICLQVCLRSAIADYSDRTILEIEMLSGFQPYKTDLEQIYAKKESLSLRSLRWDEEKMAVIMTFDQVARRLSTCVSFRALERRDVSRRNPAMVTVRAHEDPEPTCVKSYDPATPEMNLAVYCANSETSNQGQCRCFSGVCGTCITDSQTPSLSDMTQLTCNSRYVYKIRQTHVNTSTEWIDIEADVISTERPGDYAETNLQIVTPVNCPCPRTFSLRTPVYFFGSHVDVFVNRANSRTRTYVADHTTTFVSQNLNDRTGQYIRMAATQTCPP